MTPISLRLASQGTLMWLPQSHGHVHHGKLRQVMIPGELLAETLTLATDFPRMFRPFQPGILYLVL